MHFRSTDNLDGFDQNRATSALDLKTLACLQSIEKRCKQSVHKAKLNIFITNLLSYYQGIFSEIGDRKRFDKVSILQPDKWEFELFCLNRIRLGNILMRNSWLNYDSSKLTNFGNSVEISLFEF